ncbi:MAG: enoyl-CoA hydratase/isomerase family protein [Acidimicrobiaceae bacterium]|nr:enoyl-CoA hydratase/isomerase family protein [Acidimicrobiaceae bacterium]MYI35497.1 enoyl-CoA hydratase/isomerase family protein [Acidimicrobiaceae bacterium]
MAADPEGSESRRALSELVLYETDAQVGIITVNRPDKLNAISPRLMHAWWDALRTAEADESTSVVVLRSEGRSFCVGFDISGAEPEPGQKVYGHDALSRHAMLAEGLEFMLAHWYLRKPVIASVQGHAVGGGCEIALLCDITIAAADAVFGEPEVRFSDPGPGLIMPWIIGYKRARELHYLGDLIDAPTALELGMVNRVVPTEELRTETLAYARRMALIAPEALAAAKLGINRGADAAGFRSAIHAGLDVVAPVYAAETAVGKEFRERAASDGLKAALAWRRAQFDD